MVMVTRLSRVVVAAAATIGLAACSAAPSEPSPSEPAPTVVTSSSLPSASQSPTVGSPSPSSTTSSPSDTTTPTPQEGVTLRQLGFENGPLDEFSVPSDAVVSTSVDQPNVVTIVLSRPSPQTVEDYLRATLPGEGFTIGARGTAGGGAMMFEGNGWRGGFTGTAATSAIVLRPT
jgi:hypothetical protein